MKTKEVYQRPTIEVIDIELEAAILAGSDERPGKGF